jgi:hypothetical protein
LSAEERVKGGAGASRDVFSCGLARRDLCVAALGPQIFV